jgi:hypothetical protein
VTELTPSESENPLSGYGKTVSHVIVGLKTVKGTKQLRLDPTIYEAILKEKDSRRGRHLHRGQHWRRKGNYQFVPDRLSLLVNRPLSSDEFCSAWAGQTHTLPRMT